ncbi:Endonuclease/exonuclease/phosphatase superfamily [Arabidopsis suecica]|uniref:Endonuclease/exonuclease/phosphatase superfamily n=1 Tax=Arabidopsis suecica TaxID=45249 RepID=A0A8T2AI74_ARASU|nr:Endonuclease/exonuclease/phosphatase superfamily [Arabidopsis suecica]
MDKAMMAMSLEEEDVPFEMPALPEYSSCERNTLSLVGRLLNPDCQVMKHLIRDMPRKWQKKDKVRGIALSSEKFQFIFNSKYDLDDVLEKGLHTYNEWALAVERWVEHPPDNYLMFVPIWVQIWRLPINFYTTPAITALADLIGQVKVVEFDPDKPQILEYVRALVIFDVSRPLRRAKVVNLPHGETTKVHFEYERVQKRCYECQRLTHEREACPLFLMKLQEKADARKKGQPVAKEIKAPFLKESDVLFGILEENQVGINPLTGRQRIAPEVLDGMRQYLNVSMEDERLIRIDRIKKSLKEVESDPILAKSYLQLEPPPLVVKPSVCPKGIVFSYEDGEGSVLPSRLSSGKSVMKADQRQLGIGDLNLVAWEDRNPSYAPMEFLCLAQPSQDISTVYRIGSSGASSSGNIQKNTKQRKRPSKITRKLKAAASKNPKEAVNIKEGLGRSQDLAIPRLEEMRKKHFPEMLFLMETMNGRDVLVDIQEWLGYDRVYTVEPIGKCGGLALFWKSSIKLDFLFFDKNLLDVQAQFGASNFFLSCVYGDPDSSKRSNIWERISRLGVGRRERWCMIGDFNAILHNGEKIGGPRRSDSCFKPFSEMLSACDMMELPSSGNKFTWAGRRGDHWIQCRLDRAFGNKAWFEQFPVSNQAFLDMRGSDHRPVFVSLLASQDSYRGQFRFDKRFLHKPGVKDAILKAWSTGGASQFFKVSHRLRCCRKSLSAWKRNNNLNSHDKIKRLEEALEKLQSERWPDRNWLFRLKKDLAEAYREEESFWKQRSRQKWLRSGNRNSKYFHASVKGNRSRKRIEKLKDAIGVFQFSEAAKGEVASNYFENLFKSSNPPSFNDWFEGFLPKVTDEMNVRLIARVSKEEIREAAFSVKASSAPGADGMSALFFQQYWYIVGDQVTKEIQAFFANGSFPPEWNYTHLCLIPKIHHPTDMSDLRPISLCSVLYKIVSKILVRRLKPILPQIVSVNQSAFVSERQITDNILVAHELVHSLRTNPSISSEFMVVKSDMSKAYDRVEWSYLRSLLLALGFHRVWTDWIMVCVSSVTYSVLINDHPYGMITPQRGIRQGDPLSPFLFVLCTEGLTHMLNVAQRRGSLHGIKFSEDGPEIHHLLFADDSLFMCKASKDQGHVLQKILNEYGAVTGQSVNLSKSAITFGSRVDPVTKLELQNILGILTEGGTGSYLGLPECFSGSKVELLGYIKDRLKEKLAGWSTRFLSQGGKEVLLKSVALAMPVFAMSCFKLPKTTCDNLASAMADFWWSVGNKSGKIHWQSWEKLCLPKDLGGLGFRDIQGFNQALLAKQAWRILHEPSCLFAQLMKSRYFESSDFLDASLGTRPSFAWRSILHGRDLLNQGILKKVGNGKSMRVWIDPWIEDDGWRAPLRRNNFFNPDLRVSELLNRQTRSWDMQILQEHFLPDDIERILKIKPAMRYDDFFAWRYNKGGNFSVKSAYWLASQSINIQGRFEAAAAPSTNGLKHQVWDLPTDPKLKIFLWKALSAALPVAGALAKRGLNLNSKCQICGMDEEETTNHILFSCSLSRQIWALSDYPGPEFGFQNGSIFSNIHHLLDNRSNLKWPALLRTSFPWILWRIWTNRNLTLFEGKSFSALETVEKIREEVNEWMEAQKVESEDEEPSVVVVARDGPQVNILAAGVWRPPDVGWLKCNIGVAWSRRNRIAGGAWVVRDEKGVVLLHSRKGFLNVCSKMDAQFEILMWCIESMRSHNLGRVMFVLQADELVGAVNRPMAWPSFYFHSSEVRELLKGIIEWKLSKESVLANRGASLIAQTVTSDLRLHSYVASGHPSWLNRLFEDERALASF